MSSNGSHSSILHRPPLRSFGGQVWIRIRNAPNVDFDDTLVGPAIAQIEFTWIYRVLRHDL
jgi:hypothetical protein